MVTSVVASVVTAVVTSGVRVSTVACKRRESRKGVRTRRIGSVGSWKKELTVNLIGLAQQLLFIGGSAKQRRDIDSTAQEDEERAQEGEASKS